MMHLKSINHSDQVLDALQNYNNIGNELLIRGNDELSIRTDNLWMFSPFVRSIISSINNAPHNPLILPDYSSEDIKTGLSMLEEKDKDSFLVFNSRIKELKYFG